MRVRHVGTSALLLECADVAQAHAWHAELRRRRAAGELSATEIVPGARSVLLDGLPAPAETAARLAAWPPPAPSPATDGPLVTVPTVFDGADLPAVATHWGVDVAQAVQRLTGTELRVAFCGFAPGFPYLTGLPPAWAVPRLTEPRPRIPAGSVGLAGEYAGIYPGASPGGWRLVGRTALTLFDVHREPPALLTPGTRVQLATA